MKLQALLLSAVLIVVAMILATLFTGCAANPPCEAWENDYWGTCVEMNQHPGPYYPEDRITTEQRIKEKFEWSKKIK